VSGALEEVHRLPREILWKRDRHRTSTKFRLRVIRWVHELCKWPSYYDDRVHLALDLKKRAAWWL
jgi:hypothetical protein